jgi:hypothetical protein
MANGRDSDRRGCSTNMAEAAPGRCRMPSHAHQADICRTRRVCKNSQPQQIQQTQRSSWPKQVVGLPSRASTSALKPPTQSGSRCILINEDHPFTTKSTNGHLISYRLPGDEEMHSTCGNNRSALLPAARLFPVRRSNGARLHAFLAGVRLFRTC